MKRFLFFTLLLLVPFFAMAQASGGQIKRNIPQKSVSKKKSTSTLQKQPSKKTPAQQSQVVINKERTESEIINDIINNMVFVEGGTFNIGGTREQGSDINDNERPVHPVSISSYYIAKYEVTIEEWNTVMGISWSDHSHDHNPKGFVSWNECQSFIYRLNSLTGKRFRLPTEAEWEYAARGGKNSRNYKYSGSNNYIEVACKGESDVGSKKANELGLYDMSGSVWEWCQDIYGNYSSNYGQTQTNPTGPSIGETKVIRGGGFISPPEEFRVSKRVGFEPDRISMSLGFRLAL